MRVLIIHRDADGVRIGLGRTHREALIHAFSMPAEHVSFLILLDEEYGIQLSIPPGGLAHLTRDDITREE